MKKIGRYSIGEMIKNLSAILFCTTIEINIIGKYVPFAKGQYVLLLSLIMMIIGTALQNEFIIKIKFSKYQGYLLGVIIFTFCSGLWAIDSNLTNMWGSDFIGTFLMMYVIYICYRNESTIDTMLKIFMISGYFVIISSIMYYGIDYFVLILKSSEFSISNRLSNDFINANVLGMRAAYSILINIYLFLYKKSHVCYLPFSFLCILIIAFSQSRKAIIIIGIGTFMMLILKNMNNKNFISKFWGLIKILIVLIVLWFVISYVPAFSALNERMQYVVNYFSGKGEVGLSITERSELIKIGKEIFVHHPILGIGIDNAKLVVLKIMGKKDYYLHNNYWEMLADGGIIGFIIYYWIYAFILKKMIKFRRLSDGEFVICFTFLILSLILDNAAVSYLSKTTYYKLLFIFIYCERLTKYDDKNKGKLKC